MSAIEVRPVEFPRDSKAFIDVWWPIYKDYPNWVPPLRLDILRFLNPTKNPYFQVAAVQPFIAYKNGVAVGTIAATVDDQLQTTEPGIGLFGFFEFVDDREVSAALYEAARKWLKEKGMTHIRGPYNFNTNHEFGLLVDGFDDIPCVANPYNASYYVDHYEALGLEKVRDWYAYHMGREGPPEIVKKIADRFMSRHPEVEIRPLDMKHYWDACDEFWQLYNDAWEDNWGHIHMSRDEFMEKARGLKQIIEPRLALRAYVNGELAAAALTLPDYNQVAVKMNGRLFPFGWWHFLMGRKKIDRLRVLVLGVKHEFQKMPLGAPLYLQTWETAWEMGIRDVEASLVLEDNARMRGSIEKLGLKIWKTYRTCEVPL
ncbi:MAG: N-acetyltransferase [Alphaproteobacteria bacterium]|nr:N-acetyltransferase [Alphaproteobacteria bacterium]